MRLGRLLEGLEYTLLQGDPDVEISDVYYDSRQVKAGGLFVCIAGTRLDSHDLAAEAVRHGAAALIVEHTLAPAVQAAIGGVTLLRVASSRRALALVSAAYFGHPARQLTMIGVTGTKGKTTTAHMIGAVLAAAGRRVGLIGTNGVEFSGRRRALPNTTPESYLLQKLLRELVDQGCDTCVMEVSSQGLMMDRVGGIVYDVGVFTNLYPDHIGPGEHADFAEYRAWKAELFRRCAVGVVNADDPNTPILLQGHRCRVVPYGFGEEAVCRARRDYRLLRSRAMLGVAFTWEEADGRVREAEVAMPGLFSIYNALAAIATARVLAVDTAAIRAGLRQVVVKGRVELVPVSDRFTVLIDYAHNEAAAENLLTTLRAYRPARLVVVFGCGGERSRLRRYGMGEVCARLADLCILTEDNNRHEAVADILADIRVGLARGDPATPFVEIPDRLQALHYAIDQAQSGDMIAVIGKGHETYRDRQGVKTPFMERELIEAYAAARGVQ